jgi:DNA repair protein RadA/Sms
MAMPRVCMEQVLFMEGESSEGRRLLRVHKNRNGPTDEVGIFKIDSRGLHAQANPSALFLDALSTGGHAGGGAAVLGVCMMGNRAVVLEVQAMCSRAYNTGSPPTRSASGVSRERFAMLIAVMGKALPSCRALPAHHVYVNVVKGAQFKEPAADLAMATAIAASFFDVAAPAGLAVLGEVDLGGQLRGIGSLEARVLQVAALGLCDRCIVPQVEGVEKLASDPRCAGLTLVPCATLADALREALGHVVDTAPASAQRRGKGGGKGGGTDSDDLWSPQYDE